MAVIKHLIETDYKGNFNNMGERIEAIEKEVHNPSFMKLTHEGVDSFKVGTDSNGVSVALDSTNSAMDLEGQTLVNLFDVDSIILENYWTKNDNVFAYSGNGTSAIHFDTRFPIKSNTDYTFIMNVTENNVSASEDKSRGVRMIRGESFGGNNAFFLPSNFTGTMIQKITTPVLTEGNKRSNIYVFNPNKEELTFKFDSFIILEGDYTNKPISFFKGLQSVGEKVELKQGKNLFNLNNALPYGTQGGVPNLSLLNYTINGNSVTLTKIKSGGFFGDYIETTVGKTYTVSFKGSTNGDIEASLYVYSDVPYGTVLTSFVNGKPTTASRTFKATSSKIFVGAYLASGIAVDGGTITYSDIMLEEGSVATEYEEFKGKPIPKHKIEILSVGKNLLSGWQFNVKMNTVTGTIEQKNLYATSNFIEVKGDTEYYISEIPISYNPAAASNNNIVSFYDKNKNFISRTEGSEVKNRNFTTPTNAKYLAIGFVGAFSSKSDMHDILSSAQIQLEIGSMKTDYQKYLSNKTEIFLDEPLRSLPNGVADTTEIKDGKLIITRRCGEVVLDGSESWTLWNGTIAQENTCAFMLVAYLSNGTLASSEKNNTAISDKFVKYNNPSRLNEAIGEGFACHKSIYLRVSKSKLTEETSTALKNWLQQNPTTIVYQLETPIKEEFDLLNPILYKDGHVFLETGAIPCSSVSHEVALNTKAQVKNNSKAIVSCRNIYNEAVSVYDEMLLALDYDHTLFDFEYKMNKFGMEEV